ncbi:PREDICTED: peroxiredoxin Q, chloroplastic-like [Ipomoea nil]|uniref:peroxiredoxin Q, chloroplastic-like n=1 Tax=Ipomoea nil TaxID=35883 RepID=UPI000900B1F5|nr:PREDICTED: peroxiredoxin Q, chloroplastic-like [Ipomoea nil]
MQVKLPLMQNCYPSVDFFPHQHHKTKIVNWIRIWDRQICQNSHFTAFFISSFPEMASLSLSAKLTTLPYLLHTQSPKTPLSHNLSIISKSSESQFYGLKLHRSSSPSLPSSSSSTPRSFIFAKVNKGSAPPAFTLKDQDGRNVSLSKFKGKPVVVYFYPADETPGCTKQACAFRDSYEKFKKAGAEVVGISGDDTSSHKAFAKKYRLPFTLLSDEGDKVRKEWGVPSDLFGALPGRQTYVLDKNGVVQLIYNNQFQPEKHIDETLKLLQSL